MLVVALESYKLKHRYNRAHLSASSRITILCLPGGSVTFFCAKALILFRTTSIPLHKVVGVNVSLQWK